MTGPREGYWRHRCGRSAPGAITSEYVELAPEEPAASSQIAPAQEIAQAQEIAPAQEIAQAQEIAPAAAPQKPLKSAVSKAPCQKQQRDGRRAAAPRRPLMRRAVTKVNGAKVHRTRNDVRVYGRPSAFAQLASEIVSLFD
jgi:hypothetical protein